MTISAKIEGYQELDPPSWVPVKEGQIVGQCPHCDGLVNIEKEGEGTCAKCRRRYAVSLVSILKLLD